MYFLLTENRQPKTENYLFNLHLLYFPRLSDRQTVKLKLIHWRLNKVATQQMISYRILLKKEPEGGYTVTVPSLTGCVTYGKTIEEAIEMAKEAIELYLESLKSHNEEIPTDEGTLEYTLTVGIHA